MEVEAGGGMVGWRGKLDGKVELCFCIDLVCREA